MVRFDEAVIEADPDVPIIHITRDFAASPEQLLKAHTDPDLFARWIGSHGLSTQIDYWDARTGDGRTRLHTKSLVDSFEGRDAWLRSGMEVGVNDGYAKLEAMLADARV